MARAELIESLWPNAFVEEANLTVTISMLRKALGENGTRAEFIETVAKRGYRFVPPVRTIVDVERRRDVLSAMEIVRLTHDGHIMEVAISPDARLLAYVLIEHGKQSLRIEELVSGNKWEVLPPDPALCWGLKFTHDSQTLFYVTTQPDSTIS